MYFLYKGLTHCAAPILRKHLEKRQHSGKETERSLHEKQAIINKQRPEGKIFWVHAASIGEAQSSLILIHALRESIKDIHILITTGTITSAEFLESKLPENVIHQFLPLDHPKWVKAFMDHWKPNTVFWLESELWPNILNEVRKRSIPSFLINAHMSDKSFQNWSKAKLIIKPLLCSFTQVFCQAEQDQAYYHSLSGRDDLKVFGNIKYSAHPLSYNSSDYEELKKTIGARPIWLYASTHADEEVLAVQTHNSLKNKIPELLTIIVPRHPARRDEIMDKCKTIEDHITLRGNFKNLPSIDTQVYIADTIGELGLFYKLAPIACIGRSFSNDGGGGHNPIEAIQLGCSVLYGPHVQNLQEIFDDLSNLRAAMQVQTTAELADALFKFLNNEDQLREFQKHSADAAQDKTTIIDHVMEAIYPYIK